MEPGMSREAHDFGPLCDGLETGGTRTKKLRSWSERSGVLNAKRRKGPHLFQKRQATRLNECLCGGRPGYVSRRGRVFWLAAYTRVPREITNSSISLISILLESLLPPRTTNLVSLGSRAGLSLADRYHRGSTDHDQLEPLSFTSLYGAPRRDSFSRWGVIPEERGRCTAC